MGQHAHDQTHDAKMAVVLKELTRAISAYLGRALARLNPDAWWDELVVPNLSTQQGQRVRQTHCADLSGLDLAALLRVLDTNWWELSRRDSLPPECRHYLKELQSVRNR